MFNKSSFFRQPQRRIIRLEAETSLPPSSLSPVDADDGDKPAASHCHRVTTSSTLAGAVKKKENNEHVAEKEANRILAPRNEGAAASVTPEVGEKADTKQQQQQLQ